MQRLKWAVKALGPAECRDTDKSDTAYYLPVANMHDWYVVYAAEIAS